jgi:SAM-dependent methyltransferase
VLDLGSGPGRDAGDLRVRGLRAVALDLSIGMLCAGAAEYRCPRVQGDLRVISVHDSVIAGVWANASLLHVSPEDFAISLREISRVLVPGGRFFVSVKPGIGAELESKRYGLARWFQYWTASDLDGMLVDGGFEIHGAGEYAASRDRWIMRCSTVAG